MLRNTAIQGVVLAVFACGGAKAACYTPDSIPPGVSTYAANYFVDLYPTGRPVCPSTSPITVSGVSVYAYALSTTESPGPAMLICTGFSGGNYCDAWPQSSDLHYSWAASGGVTLGYPPNPSDHDVYVNCSSNKTGTVTVTIMSPGWTSETTSTSAFCGNQ